MTDVYAAYGPLPSSLGVTPSPPPDLRNAYRLYENVDPENDGLANRHRRSATLDKCPRIRSRSRSRPRNGRSNQDLRRSISRIAMERTPEPLQLLENLNSLDNSASRLRGSLQKLDSPICMDRRRNGSITSSATLDHNFTTSFGAHPCSTPITRIEVPEVYGSKREMRAEDIVIENKCCCSSMFCKALLSIFLCLVIIFGVVAGLYYFTKHVPYQHHSPTNIDIFDPCSTIKCQHGAICVRVTGSNTGQCQCPTDCMRYGHDLVSSTVCSSDGKNYENECDLLKTACYQQKHLPLRYKGKCNPCEDVGCTDRQICQLDRDRRPMCRCNDICNREFDPVCASDGKTYMNECIMKIEGCRRRRPLSIIYRGECSGEVNPCGSKVCLPGEECNIDIFGIARCECPPPCEPAVRPVCGSDNNTYDNECELHRMVCFKQISVTVTYVGICGEQGPCSHHRCDFGAVCVEGPERAECKCPECTSQLDPVCASDGLSYDNECLLKAESCRQNRHIVIRYRGKCSGCEDKVCNFYGVCEANGRGEGECVCSDICSNTDSPVCGTDGITYLNECHLKVSSCKKEKLIVVASRGDCDLCKHVVCKYGARCQSGECICPTSCLTTREPVCASNGVTYLNECEMQKASCRMGRGVLRVVFFGECAEAARSSGITGSDPCTIMSCDYGSTCVVMPDGLPRCACTLDCTDDVKNPVCASDLKMYPNECTMNREACQRQVELRLRPLELCEDYELIPCNGASPILNPATGRDFYCGAGPDKEECPVGSYCHWSLSFAKCCPLSDDVNISISAPSCKSSQFGCCPDATKTAYGPNYAGCPSICQCHKLGAYGESCDPITNQCRCKAGVGGTKCDRCEPGYWGLPLIQQGTKGCQPCACSLFGSARDDCEQMTGQCVCKPGIGGKKCNLCPENLILGPKGCSIEKHFHGDSPQDCSDLECYFGAKCHIRDKHAECLCEAQCPSDSSSATPVCGSDIETYGSECHLKLYACRYQKDVVVDSLGPCPPLGNQSDGVTEAPNRRSTATLETHKDDPSKSTRDLLPEYFLLKGPMTSSLSNSVLQPTPISFRVFGLLGSLCYRDKDCSVAYSHCERSICTCKKGFIAGDKHHQCIATSSSNYVIHFSPCLKNPCKYGGTCQSLPGGSFTCVCSPETTGPLCESFVKSPYTTPSFSGKSFMELRKIKAYNKVQIVIEFRSFKDDGLLIYSQQKEDGLGDFLSIALIGGYVEFRYNLGSGSALIRSHHQITHDKYHKVIAKRYQRDGMLHLDEYEGTIGQAPGHLKSLDLRGPTFLGHVSNGSQKIFENIGTSDGLFGCVKSLSVNGRPIDLLWPSSPHIIKINEVSECSKFPCYSLPCQNQGSCEPLHQNEFQCLCPSEFSGKLCEQRESPCGDNPCHGGGTCIPLPTKGFVCKCPPDRTGNFCEKLDRVLREIVIPEFSGYSYLEFATLDSVGKSFAIEIWFLPKEQNGVLLYNGQSDSDSTKPRDFVALNIRNGYVEFTYNLGSGPAKLTTEEKVKLNVWQVVKAKRKKRRGLLQLGKGKRIRGKSGPKLSQLNLDLPLSIGGISNLSEVSQDSGITKGFCGSVQRLIINSNVIEDLGEMAVGGKSIKRYHGPPCDHSPCMNGGICQPFLNRFLCKCHSEFYGKFCEKISSVKDSISPVSFDGATYLQFTPDVYIFNSTMYNDSINEYWDYSYPQPWTDDELSYPSNYDEMTLLEDYFFDEVTDDYYDDEIEVEREVPNIVKSYNLDNQSERLKELSQAANNLSIPPLPTKKDNDIDSLQTENISNKNITLIEEEYSHRSQASNHFELNIRTTSGDGLILWMSKGSSLKKDYIAIALSGGYAQVAFNLGKQIEPLIVTSKVKIDDDKWHTAVVYRRKLLCILKVDSEQPVKAVAEKGSKYLNTNGRLWIGGTSQLPEGLPSSYYIGFKGCIQNVEVEHRTLNLLSHQDNNDLLFCNVT